VDYVKQRGTSQAPRGHKTIDGFLLGEWVSRRRKKRGEHSALDQLLESLPGWTWAPHERGFEEQLARYEQAVAAGNFYRDRGLRTWASRQRRLVREGDVSTDRLEQPASGGGRLMCRCISIPLKHCAQYGFRTIYHHRMRRDPAAKQRLRALVERDRYR
jgi:hypothetical protein